MIIIRTSYACAQCPAHTLPSAAPASLAATRRGLTQNLLVVRWLERRDQWGSLKLHADRDGEMIRRVLGIREGSVLLQGVLPREARNLPAISSSGWQKLPVCTGLGPNVLHVMYTHHIHVIFVLRAP